MKKYLDYLWRMSRDWWKAKREKNSKYWLGGGGKKEPFVAVWKSAAWDTVKAKRNDLWEHQEMCSGMQPKTRLESNKVQERKQKMLK